MASLLPSTPLVAATHRSPQAIHRRHPTSTRPSPALRGHQLLQTLALQETKKAGDRGSAEGVTERRGPKFSLPKILLISEGDGKEKSRDGVKELLGKYGGAYLATSVTLSSISLALCYLLIRSTNVELQPLLSNVGIHSEKVGAFALAYAAHKAASFIRFPLTVALTPIVAGWIRKKQEKLDQ